MIFDADNNPIAGFNLPLGPGDVYSFQIRVDCRSHRTLMADTVADLAVEGRVAGIGSYINLESVGIDLAPYAGNRKTFDIKITAGVVTSLVQRQFKIRDVPTA